MNYLAAKDLNLKEMVKDNYLTAHMFCRKDIGAYETAFSGFLKEEFFKFKLSFLIEPLDLHGNYISIKTYEVEQIISNDALVQRNEFCTYKRHFNFANYKFFDIKYIFIELKNYKLLYYLKEV